MATQKQIALRNAGLHPETYAICVLDRRCIERSAQTTVSVLALQMELRNYTNHGRPEHEGDWYNEWNRTRAGTLSWDC